MRISSGELKSIQYIPYCGGPFFNHGTREQTNVKIKVCLITNTKTGINFESNTQQGINREQTMTVCEYIKSPGDEGIAGRCGDYKRRTGEGTWRIMGNAIVGGKRHGNRTRLNETDT